MKNKLTLFNFLILFLLIGYNINYAQAPSTQASNIIFTNVQTNQFDVSWTNGDGANRAVFVLLGSSGTALPVDSTTYTANTNFGSGGQIGSTGWSCVYNSTGNSVTVTGLTPGTTYRVMVTEYNGVPGAEQYLTTVGTNNPLNQITVPSAPTATAATSITSNSFVANWNSVTGADDYRLDVSTDNFSTFVTGYNNLTVSGITTSVTGLTSGVDYQYRVRAVNTGGTSANSNVISDTTLLPAPTLSSPANTLTGVSIRPTFSWTWSGSGTVNYQIQVSTSNTFGTTVFDSTFSSATSVTLEEARKLSNNVNYYWRVRAIQGSNNSSWSSIYSFKTIPVVTILPISPVNASTNVEFNPTYYSFQSLNGNGTLSYVIQYYEKNTEPTMAEWAGANTITITNLLSQLPYSEVLKANKKYYWRVVVKNASNEIISYSGNYYFTTKSGAYTPYLSYPTGGVTVYTNTPTFYWYIGTSDLTNINFTLVTATNNTFTAGVDSVVNINSIQYEWTGTPFTPGTTYYWKVLCWYKKGVAGEQQVLSSNYSSFIPKGSGTATTPYLSYPTGGLTIYTTTPTLYWYTGASTDGVVFDVYIKLSTAGSYTQIKDNTSDLFLDLSGTLLNPFSLSAGSTYNWYVVAQGTNGDFASSSGTFTVSSSIGTGSPIASWPVGNPYVYSLTPTLYWYMYGSTTGLTKFVLKYKQLNSAPSNWDSEAGTTNADITDLNATHYDIPSNLTAGQKYYWAIAGYNGGTRVTAWSEGSFTVSNTTTAVNVYLSAPVGGTTVFTLTPTLYWYATGAISGITSYELTYSNTSGFVSGPSPAYTTIVIGLTDNFYTLPSNSVNAGATIYWKVTAYYTGGGSSTSSTGYFVIDPGSSSIIPLVGSPINSVQLKTTAATLSWVIPAQPKTNLTYTLEYADNNNFSNSKLVNEIKQNSYSITGLKDNSTYYWRVKSNAGNTSSKFSEVAQFKTNAKVTAVDENQIPTEFSLEQNYPNPFNPSTVIKYTLPKNEFVTVKIYDMLGREVKTLVSRENTAGNYSVEWNGDDNFGNKVSAGTYIYRITAGNFVAVKKMLLIK